MFEEAGSTLEMVILRRVEGNRGEGQIHRVFHVEHLTITLS
jgi:hypothetical protein